MTNWINTKTENKSKIVVMHWNSQKRHLFLLGVFIFAAMEAVILSIFRSFYSAAYVFFVFLIVGLLLYLFYYPLRVTIKKDSRGNIQVEKRDFFFIIQKNEIKASQNPIFVLKKKTRFGLKVFLMIPIYQPMLRFKEDGTSKEVSLLLNAHYIVRSNVIVAPSSLSIFIIDKRAAELSRIISTFLRMKCVVEE